jgi:hypothetical protein
LVANGPEHLLDLLLGMGAGVVGVGHEVFDLALLDLIGRPLALFYRREFANDILDDAVHDDGPADQPVIHEDRLRSAFENSRDAIEAEIGNCRTAQDCKGLKEDLELFASSLGVDVSYELERLDEANSEFDDYEERRADAMMDEYRDQYRESRTSEASVRDMFDSLRGDRGG